MLKISAVYLYGKPEIPIHYTSLSQVEQALSQLLASLCFYITDAFITDKKSDNLDKIEDCQILKERSTANKSGVYLL